MRSIYNRFLRTIWLLSQQQAKTAAVPLNRAFRCRRLRGYLIAVDSSLGGSAGLDAIASVLQDRCFVDRHIRKSQHRRRHAIGLLTVAIARLVRYVVLDAQRMNSDFQNLFY